MIILANTTVQLSEQEISLLVNSVEAALESLAQPCQFFLEQLDNVCVSPSARHQIHLTVFVQGELKENVQQDLGNLLLGAIQKGLHCRESVSCAVIIKHIPAEAIGIDGVFLPDCIPTAI